ncbi:PDGLE domain-containing protein [Nocardioides sp.]|uniref:PDGLE domain-containing protein n=1 Tax=Nocardioides sp. TaxID=35761 RepID=UPI003568F4C9
MSRPGPVSTRAVRWSALVVALLLAGVVSFYAATSPDGLNRVAQDQGFASTETEHAAGDGPLSDYQTRGVDQGRLSGGAAGVVGVLVVLGLATALTYAVRRRPSRTSTGA